MMPAPLCLAREEGPPIARCTLAWQHRGGHKFVPYEAAPVIEVIACAWCRSFAQGRRPLLCPACSQDHPGLLTVYLDARA